MSKTSTELQRHALNGPTMGTRWTALFHAPSGFDSAPVQTALQAAVDDVDQQMSTWKADSDLMRINRAAIDEWIDAPAHLLAVLRLGLAIGRASDGAFDIGMGDAVTAWGFGATAADATLIRRAMRAERRPAHEILELGDGRLRKLAPIALDLNGIAKGFGVDRLAETLMSCGIHAGLVGIDGEMRALGLRPDGAPWAIAVEAPNSDLRTPHSMLTLEDAAVATSGDYRHWIDVGGTRLSHTMNPALALPLAKPPASVTVVARTCAEADAWATALMVLGESEGLRLAQELNLQALFIIRQDRDLFTTRASGNLFAR